MAADEFVKRFNGFASRSLSQETKQITIFHGGLPDGVNRCLNNLMPSAVRLSYGAGTLFKF